MRSLHSDLYDKADELYQNTRLLYPDGVKDLTKTVEFMVVTKPGKTIPRYYSNRKTNKAPIGTSNGREMVLEIPLMSQTEMTSPPVAAPSPTVPLMSQMEMTSPPVAAPSPTTPLMSQIETTSPPVAAPFPTAPLMSQMEMTSPPVAAPSPTTPLMSQMEMTSPPVVAPSPTAVSQPLLLEQHVYEELLQDLQKDPDLSRILNDFPNDFPPDDTLGLWNDFPPDDMMELTPLERELQQLY